MLFFIFYADFLRFFPSFRRQRKFLKGAFFFLSKKIPEKNFNKTETYKINFYSDYLTNRCAHDKIQL